MYFGNLFITHLHQHVTSSVSTIVLVCIEQKVVGVPSQFLVIFLVFYLNIVRKQKSVLKNKAIRRVTRTRY